MELVKINIKNFKGIGNVDFDLSKSPRNNVYTLVGINESGKTTILEAINSFEYNDEKDLATSQIRLDEIIPIKKVTNFNESIVITSSLSVDEKDKEEIKEYLLRNHGYILGEYLDSTIEGTQTYRYKNSIHEESKFLWNININVKKKGARKFVCLWETDKDVWLKTTSFLEARMPKILYFPTAFFNLPDRICLSGTNDDINDFFKSVVQDILDSLDEGLTIETHIIDRVKNSEKNPIQQLCLKMSRKINNVILHEWQQVLNNTQYNIRVDIYSEANQIFLDFNVEGTDGIFKLSERSLGFRWFFVFLLLTQFRGFRKNENRHIVFMFDEPAANLSNKAQRQLLSSLERISDKCTIIYTTFFVIQII